MINEFVQLKFENWQRRRGKVRPYFKKDARGKYEDDGAYAEWVAFQAGFAAARVTPEGTVEDIKTLHILEMVVRAYEKHDGLQSAAAYAKTHLRKRAAKEEKVD